MRQPLKAKTKEIAGKTYKNIKGEVYRNYVYTTDSGAIAQYKIENPIWVCVDGPHRVIDANNVVHWIKPGWIAMNWHVEGRELIRF